jgi:hypothetical protein
MKFVEMGYQIVIETWNESRLKKIEMQKTEAEMTLGFYHVKI